ncbi:MAG TPA: TerB family tellurite resistance protein [Polyangiaceae bacterium]|nr:TerB family tellurite resistance protein [Polyangiaceae bacterium]
MLPLDLPPGAARAGLRAMATVARADGRVDPAELALVQAAARALGVSIEGPEALAPIEPAALADALPDPAHRLIALQAMILTALMDGDASGREADAVRRFAESLGVDEPRVANLRQLAEGRTRALWLDLARRSFARPIFEQTLRAKGLGGVWKIVGPLVGLAKDHDLARRYNDLGRLPEGTLGRAYWRFVVDHELGFPGEGVVAEEGVWHDLSHVLGGYGVDPSGEVSVVSFIAGYKRDDPFFWLFTIALQFHLGVKVSPYSPRGKGHFDPELVRRAFARGRRVNRDLSTEWGYAADLARPLDEVRRDLGVPPP